MRERLKSLSFAASLALGAGASLTMSPLLLHDGHVQAGVFDQDEDINAEARRLSKDLSDDSRPGRSQRVAGLFGESDEERAAEEAARQRENAQDASIQSLNQQVQDLQNTVRRLTGQNERLGHELEEIRTSISRNQKDFEYRLCTLSAQQLGATGQEDGGLNCNGIGATSSSAAAAPPPTPASDTSRQLAPPPGTLGTLTEEDLKGPPRGPATSAPRQLASVDSNSAYNSAMSLLAGARYDEARSAFRNFADTHPDDPLTPQAIYWVGDIAYVQKDYTGAARAFAEQIKKYPSSSRAPDSMLKLGQSLIAMGQKQEGCTTLGALKAKYPHANDAILAKAREERKAASCR